VDTRPKEYLFYGPLKKCNSRLLISRLSNTQETFDFLLNGRIVIDIIDTQSGSLNRILAAVKAIDQELSPVNCLSSEM
jgi:hypothetical protein